MKTYHWLITWGVMLLAWRGDGFVWGLIGEPVIIYAALILAIGGGAMMVVELIRKPRTDDTKPTRPWP
ncbi:MAG: hypothetical protein ACPGO3_00495 [Magnetospiraceae bacterium]